MIRLAISPSPRTIALPEDYRLSFGRGSVLADGSDAVLFAYGPVMLNEALKAGDELKNQGVSLKVVNLPWLNRIDLKWLEQAIEDCRTIFVLDNHSPYGGLGDCLLNAAIRSDNLRGRQIIKLAIEDFPACGTPPEALAYHQLDAKGLAASILGSMKRK